MKITFKTRDGERFDAKSYQIFDDKLSVKTVETHPPTLIAKIKDIHAIEIAKCTGLTQLISFDINIMKGNEYYGIINYRVGEGSGDHKQHRFGGNIDITKNEEDFVNENLLTP